MLWETFLRRCLRMLLVMDTIVSTLYYGHRRTGLAFATEGGLAWAALA